MNGEMKLNPKYIEDSLIGQIGRQKGEEAQQHAYKDALIRQLQEENKKLIEENQSVREQVEKLETEKKELTDRMNDFENALAAFEVEEAE